LPSISDLNFKRHHSRLGATFSSCARRVGISVSVRFKLRALRGFLVVCASSASFFSLLPRHAIDIVDGSLLFLSTTTTTTGRDKHNK
jgi:hypothetical protein